MTDLLNLCPAAVDLCFTRGDTVLWTFQVKSSGVAVNITGFSFRLTVDPNEDPTDALANLFVLTGTITDAPNGIVQFGMSTLQANQTPSDYFFDLEMTDGSGKIRTIAKGKFMIHQDISK